jgi:hypothetical protein
MGRGRDPGTLRRRVVDSHNGQDIDTELLDKRARLIRGWPQNRTKSHIRLNEIRFNDVVIAELASYLQGVERTSGNTCVYRVRHEGVRLSQSSLTVPSARAQRPESAEHRILKTRATKLARLGLEP